MPTRTSAPTRLSAEHGIERVDWRELGPAVIAAWGRPGGKFDPEHLTIYGPSGSGKSTLLGHLAGERNRLRGSHVVFLSTKRTDATVEAFGWPIVTDWPPGYGQTCVIYRAAAKGIDEEHLPPQKAKVRALMDALWVKGSNRIVVWDELPYIEGDLGLRRQIATYYREGRSYGITNMTSMQRPSGVTRLAHSEPVINVAFRPKDQDDRDRVAEVFGDRARYRLVLADLSKARREFVIYDSGSEEAYISRLVRTGTNVRRTDVRRTGVRSRT